jgi:hypothetical protein
VLDVIFLGGGVPVLKFLPTATAIMLCDVCLELRSAVSGFSWHDLKTEIEVLYIMAS